MKYQPRFSAQLRARATAPATPSRAGEKSSCAPRADSFSCRAAGVLSGRTRQTGWPLVRPARVRAVAKAPLPASIRVCPGVRALRSAARASIPSARPSRAVPVGPPKSRQAYSLPGSRQAAA